MINPSLLEDVIVDQKDRFRKKDAGTRRNINFSKYLETKQITVISGIRRSGKSTLLKQFSDHFDSFYYLNFDDERLAGFSVSDFQTLMLTFKKLYSADVILLDEIQNVPGWERFARRIFEEEYKIFLTGSNAHLLSSELGTHLTGRYLKLEVYPFSFTEFLNFHSVAHETAMTTDQRAELLRNFKLFIEGGGFPEFVKTKSKDILAQVFEDIIYWDLIARFKIREIKNFKMLVNYVFANAGCEMSYHAVKKFLDFKSATTVKNYIDFIQESYLAFELFKYDYSLKKQYVSNKKIYVIDNGLRGTVAFSFSPDDGKLLENAVFIELKRRGEEIYYFKEKKECDFILRRRLKITEAIQVTRALADPRTEKRELDGLLEAMDKFKLKTGTIITEGEEGEKKIGGKKIKIVPAWKWLLG